jgi:anti-sigma regulatory factor (Ser/Thr protein kinase)
MAVRPTGHAFPMAQTAKRTELLLALEPRPESARLVRRALEEHEIPEDIAHTVLLLSTEVLGNAVRHAKLEPDQRIVFFARLQSDFARIEIADPGRGFDPDLIDNEGFGLRLLGKLAARWGVDRERGCKVWFEVDRRSGRFDRAAR